MWVLRFLETLIVRTVVIAAVAFGIAGLLALASAGGFLRDAKFMCIALGCVLMAMGALGRGSNFERYADQNAMRSAWGVIPGFDPNRRFDSGEPTLSPGAALFCSGAVLLVLGIAVL